MSWYDWAFEACGYLCHQMPSRSFFLLGHQFPLCFRCTGILLGSLWFLWLVHRQKLLGMRWSLLLLSPMLADVALQMTPWWQSFNALRLFTGIGFGIGLPAWVLGLLRPGALRAGREHQAAS